MPRDTPIKKVMLVFGTRPEAIKMLPLAAALRQSGEFEVEICITAQHREMLDQVMDLFGETAGFDLNVMREAKGLTQITTAILERFKGVLEAWQPDLVMVHGDTTTSTAAALACFYAKVPVAHVEAGLRSHDPMQPWPEEINRRLTSVVTRYHFAPTAGARDNLVRENIDPTTIFVTGNTVIDALYYVREKIEQDAALGAQLRERFAALSDARNLILVTAHRRENIGQPMAQVCEALATLVTVHGAQIILPLHLNPAVRGPISQRLGGMEHVHLVEPLDYTAFCYLMNRAHCIITDSGGVQEEAPSLGKPVFVVRNVTERPEAVEAGTVKLVGTDTDKIVRKVGTILNDPTAYARMPERVNPFGDGRASRRITDILAGRTPEAFLSDQ